MVRILRGSLGVKTWVTKSPLPIYNSMFANQYRKNRPPGLLFEYDASKTAIGKANNP